MAATPLRIHALRCVSTVLQYYEDAAKNRSLPTQQTCDGPATSRTISGEQTRGGRIHETEKKHLASTTHDPTALDRNRPTVLTRVHRPPVSAVCCYLVTPPHPTLPRSKSAPQIHRVVCLGSVSPKVRHQRALPQLCARAFSRREIDGGSCSTSKYLSKPVGVDISGTPQSSCIHAFQYCFTARNNKLQYSLWAFQIRSRRSRQSGPRPGSTDHFILLPCPASRSK